MRHIMLLGQGPFILLLLPYFSFNLIFKSKLGHTLNCSTHSFLIIIWFRIFWKIGLLVKVKGLGGFYILDLEMSKSISCSRVATHSNYIVTSIIHLSLWHKLHPQFLVYPHWTISHVSMWSIIICIWVIESLNKLVLLLSYFIQMSKVLLMLRPLLVLNICWPFLMTSPVLLGFTKWKVVIFSF